jgi:hypothetical protein
MLPFFLIVTDFGVRAVCEHWPRRRDGDKVFITTVVAENCCLGASVVDTCDEAGLTEGYGVFKQETRDLDPDYTPQTVNLDGWRAAQLAWQALFPLAVILRCFLHGWLSIRDGCKKHAIPPSASKAVLIPATFSLQ